MENPLSFGVTGEALGELATELGLDFRGHLLALDLDIVEADVEVAVLIHLGAHGGSPVEVAALDVEQGVLELGQGVADLGGDIVALDGEEDPALQFRLLLDQAVEVVSGEDELPLLALIDGFLEGLPAVLDLRRLSVGCGHRGDRDRGGVGVQLDLVVREVPKQGRAPDHEEQPEPGDDQGDDTAPEEAAVALAGSLGVEAARLRAAGRLVTDVEFRVGHGREGSACCVRVGRKSVASSEASRIKNGQMADGGWLMVDD